MLRIHPNAKPEVRNLFRLFGERVRAFRHLHNLKILRFSRLADVHPSTLSNIERGDTIPSQETVRNILTAMEKYNSERLKQLSENS